MNTTDPHPNRERGPTPVTRTLRGVRDRLRKRRSGVAVIIQVLLYAALVAVIIAGAIGGPALYRQIVGGGEHNTLKTNIDNVSRLADEYWGQFAADRDGRRKIDLVEFCNYANSQLTTGGQITLRTLGVTAGTFTAATQIDAGSVADGMADGMARLSATPVDRNTATCPTNADAPSAATGQIADVATYDIVVSDTGTALGVPATHTLAATGNPATATVTIEDLERAGLASTRGVWMMQPAGGGSCDNPAAATQAAQGTCAGTNWDHDGDGGATTPDQPGVWTPGSGIGVPGGAEVTSTDRNEVLVFGGVTPDGSSFCLIKVFDANDRSLVGEYRVARQPADGANNPFAVCTQGAPGTGANTARHNAGWPEAR